MEHAQRDLKECELEVVYGCLNPYFNGTCSKSDATSDAFAKRHVS